MDLNYVRRFSTYVSTFYHSEYITPEFLLDCNGCQWRVMKITNKLLCTNQKSILPWYKVGKLNYYNGVDFLVSKIYLLGFASCLGKKLTVLGDIVSQLFYCFKAHGHHETHRVRLSEITSVSV